MNPSPNLRCPNCPNKQERHKPPIHGHGPVPCRVMVIGEGPGKQEDERRERDGHGYPFIGDSGMELDDLYLPLMGLRRDMVFVTNVIRCLPRDKHGTDNQPLAQCCSDYFLWGEIRKVRPRVIITLGAKAGHVLDPSLNLEMDHGVARKVVLNEYPVIWVPLYHPAAGMRQPEYMQALLDDCTALRSRIVYYTQGTMADPVDPFPTPDYQECESSGSVMDYLRDWPPYSPIALDTEYDDRGHLGKDPICLSFSIAPGTGRVIKADNHSALTALRLWLGGTEPLALFHNWMADVGVLRQMGLEFPRFNDTMLMAYHLGNQPQALKVLAHRLAYMEMQEFSDLVDPYWLTEVIEWAQAGALILKPPPPPKPTRVKGVKYVKPEPPPSTGFERMGTNLHRLASDLLSGKDVKVVDRYKGWDGFYRAIPRVGPIPFKSLRLVPWPKAVYYACRDADATLRIHPILRSLSWHILRDQGR